MNPVTIPMMVKTTSPLMTYGLLALVAGAFGFVCYMMLRHQHRTRKAKKRGHSPHTGHHGNH